MAEKENKLGWWDKPDHLKNDTKSTTKKSTTYGTKREQPTKPRPRRVARQPKAPLTKMGVALRTLKHIIYLVIIVVVGAVMSHYILTSVTRHNARCTVPLLESFTMDEARQMVADDELQLIINDSLYAPTYKGGVILDQLPKAGTVVKPGRSIYVTLNATQRRVVDVPYVAERSLRQAKSMLDLAGLTIGKLVYKDDLARNYILSQYVDDKQITSTSNERATMGTEVTLHVGRGSDDSTLIPMLMGLSLHNAENLLWSSGLNVGDIMYDRDVDLRNRMQARVFAQSVRANSDGRFGDEISLELSSRQEKVDSMLVLYQKELEIEQKMEALVEELMGLEVLAIEELEMKSLEELEVIKTMTLEMMSEMGMINQGKKLEE